MVDDHPIVLDGVRHLVDSTPWITLAGFARTGREAIVLAEQTRPDVVLLDLGCPTCSAPRRSRHPGARAAKVVVFGLSSTPRSSPLCAAGTCAVVLKDVDRADLVDVIRRVATGEPLDPASGSGTRGEVSQRLTHKLRKYALTRREYDIPGASPWARRTRRSPTPSRLTRNTVKTYVQSAAKLALGTASSSAASTKLGLL